MFPMRFSTIFKNRWWAVIWEAGIIWFAYDFAGTAPQTDPNNVTANAVTADDQDKVAQVLGN
jgi:hypothetical protein